MKHQNGFSYLLGNISLFKCFLLVIFVSGCISQNKSPFESLTYLRKLKTLNLHIFDSSWNSRHHFSTVLIKNS